MSVFAFLVARHVRNHDVIVYCFSLYSAQLANKLTWLYDGNFILILTVIILLYQAIMELGLLLAAAFKSAQKYWHCSS